MGDNDFPMTMANSPVGFLQTYIKGMQDYQQAGTDIPDFRLQNQYAQELGGPLMEQTIAGAPSFDINESSKQRKIRGIRKLGEGSVGGERDAALEILKRLGGAQLPKV